MLASRVGLWLPGGGPDGVAGFVWDDLLVIDVAHDDDGRLVSPFSESIRDERFYRLVCRENKEHLPSIQAVFSWFLQEKDLHR